MGLFHNWSKCDWCGERNCKCFQLICPDNFVKNWTLPQTLFNPPSPSELYDGDIIGIWNQEQSKVEHEFIVRGVEDNKILGTYIHTMEETEWRHGKDFVKICSLLKEKQ